MTNIIGGNQSTEYLPYQGNNSNPAYNVSTILTNMSKSLLRGVPNFVSSQFSNPALWYPDPALATGGLTYNAYNLDPVVWFIHAKMGLSAYSFALDDDFGNVNGPGANNLAISVGGLNGLPNPYPYSGREPWGVVTTTGTAQTTTKIGNLTNPTTPPGLNLQPGQVVNMLVQPDSNAHTPGTLINGPGVKLGTSLLTTSIDGKTPSASFITLSQPLSPSPPAGSSYSFWGQLLFTGTVLGKGQAPNQIIISSPVINGNTLAYTTLSNLGSLNNIQVTGEGIDPKQTVTIKVNGLSQNVAAGTTTVTLSANLNPKMVSISGSFYAYTFGEAASNQPSSLPVGAPPPKAPPGSGGSNSAPSLIQEIVSLVVDDFLLVIDQIVELADRALNIVPNPGLPSSITAYQNALNANPLDHSLLGLDLLTLVQLEILNLLQGQATS